MPASAASGQFHELIPVVGLFAAAAPILLQVMENRSSFMVVARILAVLVLDVIFATSLVNTS